jgi:hypothetical protein
VPRALFKLSCTGETAKYPDILGPSRLAVNVVTAERIASRRECYLDVRMTPGAAEIRLWNRPDREASNSVTVMRMKRRGPELVPSACPALPSHVALWPFQPSPVNTTPSRRPLQYLGHLGRVPSRAILLQPEGLQVFVLHYPIRRIFF